MSAYDIESALPLETMAPPEDGEPALWRRWRESGDEGARELLLELHLPYARQVAAAYYAKRLHDEIEFDEYLQLARVGLIEAMERFEVARGAQFRTFAACRMHGSIVDGVGHMTEKQQQIAARRRLEDQRSRSIRDHARGGDALPTTPAARTSAQALQYVAEAGLAFALSWLLDGTGLIHTGDRVENIPFYRSVELHQLRERVAELVRNLPPQERSVIHGHYIQGLPFEYIATSLGVTRGRVSQVHLRALERLRDVLRFTGAFSLIT